MPCVLVRSGLFLAWLDIGANNLDRPSFLRELQSIRLQIHKNLLDSLLI